MAASITDEWNVPKSDDEQDSSEAKGNKVEDELDIPLKVLLLYREIEKSGFIELKVKECRRSVKENVVQPCEEEKGEEGKDKVINSTAEEISTVLEPDGKLNAIFAANVEKDKAPEPSAFDYMEESIDETSHITRKIPKTERLHRKRVGTLENVISDLKRFRDMDTKETENTDNKSVLETKSDTTATNKDSKGL